MAKILIFDSETDKLPDWDQPSEGPDQPHLVELAAQLVDEETPDIVLEEMNVLIFPDGWKWDETSDAFKLHGITMEEAMDKGIPEKTALDQFWSLYEQCDRRSAFNTVFDNRMIRIAQKRYWTEDDNDPRLLGWKTDKTRYVCTMQASRKHLGVKSIILTEAVRQILGRDHSHAHRAMPDTEAARDLYFHLKKAGVIC